MTFSNRTERYAVVEVHSIRIDKSFKDGDQWKRTTALTAEDLLKAAIVAEEAYKFLRLHTSDNEPGHTGEDLKPGCSGPNE